MSAKMTIIEMRNLASAKRGKCLATQYIDAHTKILWQCEFGHRWRAKPYLVKQGTWCPKCRGTPKSTLPKLRKLAKKFHGKCLSKSYKSAGELHEFECNFGHKFRKRPREVTQGKWCPYCSKHTAIGEQICRTAFEQIFGRPFPKEKPVWLRIDKTKYLELDGYNRTLKIAFEHQGLQHYRSHKAFSPDYSSYLEIKKRDEFKRTKCRRQGVRLFQIPEVPTLTSVENLKTTIQTEAKRLKVRMPRGFQHIEIDYSAAFLHTNASMKMAKLREVVDKRGGVVLSKSYAGSKTPLKMKCREGHVFSARPNSVLSGQWCPECSWKHGLQKRMRYSIENLIDYAKSRGGKCLSKEYKGISHKLEFKCHVKEHPPWLATAQSCLYRNTWCIKCGFKTAKEKLKKTN